MTGPTVLRAPFDVLYDKHGRLWLRPHPGVNKRRFRRTMRRYLRAPFARPRPLPINGHAYHARTRARRHR